MAQPWRNIGNKEILYTILYSVHCTVDVIVHAEDGGGGRGIIGGRRGRGGGGG